MTSKVYLHNRKYGGDLRAMPIYLEGLDISAVKIVNVHPDNPIRNNIPTVMVIIILMILQQVCPIQ
jgi:alanine dehydrogenase